MPFRHRSIAVVLLAIVIPLLATVVTASPAAAWTPDVPIHTVRLPVDDTWHTNQFTMQSEVDLPPSGVSQAHCASATTVRFSFRLRGRSNGYDIAFFNMTNRGTLKLNTGRLSGDSYRWLPTSSLKVNETEKVYSLAGALYSAGSQTWGDAFIISVTQSGRSSLCSYEFIIKIAKNH